MKIQTIGSSSSGTTVSPVITEQKDSNSLLKDHLNQATRIVNPAQVTPYSQLDLLRLKNDLAISMNQFLGVINSDSLTHKTLMDIQSKFWTSKEKDQEGLCNLIWESCKEVAHEFNKQVQPRSITQTQAANKKPIVFSTREGLDIVVDLKHKGDNLEVEGISFNAGGSSINVARALNNFGISSDLLGIAGNGHKGNIFLDLLRKEGVDISKLIKVEEDSRFHFCKLLDGKEHWVVSLSPSLTNENLNNLTELLIKACEENKNEALALANNPPRGASSDYTPNIIREATNRFGMFVIYDTKLHAVGKELLMDVLKSGPSMIKPNISEYAEIVGEDEEKLRGNKDQIIHLAKELIDKYGINKILISLDKDGALLVDKKRAAHAIAPPIKIVSTIGAGDTGIASFIDRSKKRDFSLHNQSEEEFLSLLSAFVAGGCATVLKPGTELATLEERDNLEKAVTVKLL